MASIILNCYLINSDYRIEMKKEFYIFTNYQFSYGKGTDNSSKLVLLSKPITAITHPSYIINFNIHKGMVFGMEIN